MLGEVLRIPWLKGKAIPLGLGEVNICTPRPDSPPTIFCAKRMSIPIFLLDSTRAYIQGSQIKSAGFRQH